MDSSHPDQPQGPDSFEGFDEFIELPFGIMARQGRFITMQNLLSEEEAELFKESLRNELLPHLEERRKELRAELVDLLKSMDPIEMLMQFAIPYLSIDPNTYREWATDRSPAHVEYLAMQVLGLEQWEVNDWEPGPMSQGLTRLAEITKELFETQLHYIAMSTALEKEEGSVASDLRSQVLLHSLSVRIPSYGEHETTNLQGIFETVDDDLLSHCGFTIGDALRVENAITTTMLDPLHERLDRAEKEFDSLLKHVKRARRRPQKESSEFVHAMARLKPSEAARYLRTAGVAWAFHGSKETFALTPERIAEASAVTVEAVKAVMVAFTASTDTYQQEHHTYPAPGTPLQSHPLMKVGDDHWLCPIPQYLLYAIRPRLEDILTEDPEAWERYAEARGRFLEQATADLLGNALGEGADVAMNVQWASTSPEESGEIDVVARQDYVGLRVQCKSGRFTAPARRGAIKRMDRDLRDLIGDAAEQNRRLADALDADPAGVTIQDLDAWPLLVDPALQFDVIVTLEELGLFGAQLIQLEQFGTLPRGRLPWLTSLNDLRVISEILDGPQFLHYLSRRDRLNRLGRVFAMDELDYLGHYISEGLFFDEWAKENPDTYFRLLSYTEVFDNWYFAKEGVRTVETEKPARPMSPRVSSLATTLSSVRPDGWIIPCIAMLDWAFEAEEEFGDQWDAAFERAKQNGEASCSLEFSNYRFTIAFALDRDLSALKQRLENGMRMTNEKRGFDLGIAVGRLPPAGAYTVAVVSTELRAALERAFLEPDF